MTSLDRDALFDEIIDDPPQSLLHRRILVEVEKQCSRLGANPKSPILDGIPNRSDDLSADDSSGEEELVLQFGLLSVGEARKRGRIRHVGGESDSCFLVRDRLNSSPFLEKKVLRDARRLLAPLRSVRSRKRRVEGRRRCRSVLVVSIVVEILDRFDVDTVKVIVVRSSVV